MIDVYLKASTESALRAALAMAEPAAADVFEAWPRAFLQREEGGPAWQQDASRAAYWLANVRLAGAAQDAQQSLLEDTGLVIDPPAFPIRAWL